MKLGLFTVLTAFFIGPAHAEEIRNLTVYKDSALISDFHTHIKITDVKFVMAPKVINIVPGPCHSDMESDCTRAEVLKKVPAVQVTVEYRDGIFREENSYRTVDLELNLPVSAFSEEQIAILKNASRFSFSNRNRNTRKNFMNQNLKLEVTKVAKPTRVIDEANSKLCEVEYLGEQIPGCEEVRKYKTQIINYKNVKVSVK